jgi:ligand-binding SRPBCC domain-containing protein
MGLTYSSVIDAGRDEVFTWHTRPGAITRLIPPWQPVTVLREPGSLRDGRATRAGHRFRQPELEGTLRHLFGRDGA